jgi:hypothetical protein
MDDAALPWDNAGHRPPTARPNQRHVRATVGGHVSVLLHPLDVGNRGQGVSHSLPLPPRVLRSSHLRTTTFGGASSDETTEHWLNCLFNRVRKPGLIPTLAIALSPRALRSYGLLQLLGSKQPSLKVQGYGKIAILPLVNGGYNRPLTCKNLARICRLCGPFRSLFASHVVQAQLSFPNDVAERHPLSNLPHGGKRPSAARFGAVADSISRGEGRVRRGAFQPIDRRESPLP